MLKFKLYPNEIAARDEGNFKTIIDVTINFNSKRFMSVWKFLVVVPQEFNYDQNHSVKIIFEEEKEEQLIEFENSSFLKKM